MMQIDEINEKYFQLKNSIVNSQEAPEEVKIIISTIVDVMKDIHLTLKDISEKISAAAES